MLVTLSGISIACSDVQSEKAYGSIVYSLSGNVMLLSEEQPENALLPIHVTFSGMFTSFNLSQ